MLEALDPTQRVSMLTGSVAEKIAREKRTLHQTDAAFTCRIFVAPTVRGNGSEARLSGAGPLCLYSCEVVYTFVPRSLTVQSGEESLLPPPLGEV